MNPDRIKYFDVHNLLKFLINHFSKLLHSWYQVAALKSRIQFVLFMHCVFLFCECMFQFCIFGVNFSRESKTKLSEKCLMYGKFTLLIVFEIHNGLQCLYNLMDSFRGPSGFCVMMSFRSSSLKLDLDWV